MSKVIASAVLVVGLTFAVAPVALADHPNSHRIEKRNKRVNHLWRKLPKRGGGHNPGGGGGSVPELDPAAMGHAFALLMGAAALLDSRKRRAR